MIELRTLGGVDLRSCDGQTAIPLAAQPKRLALLVYLALGNSSGFRRRDSAVGHLWPELDTLHARGALRQALHSLRRLTGEGAIVTRGEEEIGVNREILWCDAVAFREGIELGKYEEALKLYRGDFLEGFFASDVAPEFDQWICDTRLDLRRRASGAAWAVADAHRAKADLANASSFARQASALAVEDENGVARLISFLDQLGDRSGALDAYDELSTRLKREYNAVPSPETQALIKRVRERTVASKSVLSSAATMNAVTNQVPDTRSAAVSELEAPPPNRSKNVNAPPTHKWRNRYFGVAAAMALALVVVAIAKLGQASAAAPYSVAVVPLQDLSADTSRAYIADGVTDQLITDLAQLGSLQVINRRTTSAPS